MVTYSAATVRVVKDLDVSLNNHGGRLCSRFVGASFAILACSAHAFWSHLELISCLASVTYMTSISGDDGGGPATPPGTSSMADRVRRACPLPVPYDVAKRAAQAYPDNLERATPWACDMSMSPPHVAGYREMQRDRSRSPLCNSPGGPPSHHSHG